MKIKRSELPEHIAKALEPRTFAQERPADGQNIEMQYRNGFYERAAYSAATFIAQDSWVTFPDGTSVDIGDEESAMLWRPVLELEDDAPEPERELPKRNPPKQGEYFFLDGRLTYRFHDRKEWQFKTKGADMIWAPTMPQELSELPDNWRPLSEVIAQAARVEEAERDAAYWASEHENLARIYTEMRTGIMEKEVIKDLRNRLASCVDEDNESMKTVRSLRARVEELEASSSQEDAKINELRAKVVVTETMPKRLRESLTAASERIKELEAKLKQQDKLVRMLDEILDYVTGKEVIYGKLREASE